MSKERTTCEPQRFQRVIVGMTRDRLTAAATLLLCFLLAPLFRIATNLVRDGQRRHHVELVPVPDEHSADALTGDEDIAGQAARRADLTRAMGRLTLRERELLLLASAHGSSHREIADALGLKATSIKMLLFRARRRLAELLGRKPS